MSSTQFKLVEGYLNAVETEVNALLTDGWNVIGPAVLGGTHGGAPLYAVSLIKITVDYDEDTPF